MRVSVLIAFAVALTIPTTGAGRVAEPDPPRNCATRIKDQAAGRGPAPFACWPLGPLALGMSHDEVVHRLGPADFEGDGPPAGDSSRIRHDGYRLAYYVFPRDLAQRLARRPAGVVPLRFLELAYVHGGLAQISNTPPARISSLGCGGRPAHPPETSDTPSRDFTPYLSFPGLHAGDSVAALTARFGRPPVISNARDFYNYDPFPLTLEVDDGRVGGFSIGTDSDTVLLGGFANVVFTRDPGSCRIDGYRLEPPQP